MESPLSSLMNLVFLFSETLHESENINKIKQAGEKQSDRKNNKNK